MAIDQIVAEELTRLITAKADLKTSIEAKGVTVPSSAKLDDYPDYVDAISVGATLQAKTNITPTESSQTITADNGYDGLSSVQINAISSSYVGSGITSRSSSDLTASGATVTAPAGYYSSDATKTVSSGSTTPAASLSGTSASVTWSSTNNTLTLTKTINNTPQVTAGYISSGTAGNTGISLTADVPVRTSLTSEDGESAYVVTANNGFYPSTVSYIISRGSATPTTSLSSSTATLSVGTNTLTLTKTISNIPRVISGYISAGTFGDTDISLTASVNTRSSSDLTASGATVTAPAGYYSSDATKTIADGSYGTYTVSHSKNSTYFNTQVSYPDFTAGYFGFAPSGSDSLRLETKTVTPSTTSQTVTPSGNLYYLNAVTVDAMPSGTTGTPTATKGTVSNHSVSVTPSVTNTTGYITGSTINGTAVTVSASELVSGTVNITSSGNTDVTNYATASVAAGSATASATKGTVSNHSVTVTPSVTRTAGYVTAGTANGTAVTVSASELVSGSQTITENGTIDVTNLAQIIVDVSGGGSGGSGMQIATTSEEPVTSGALVFENLRGQPTSFSVICTDTIATNSVPQIAAVVSNNMTNIHVQTITNTSNAQVSYNAGNGFNLQYSNGTFIISASGSEFQLSSTYRLIYTYGGSDISTSDVQVGSGATSITFTGLNGEPDFFSVIFKSNFSTSSGYQRVIAVAHDGTNTYGMEMDSSAKYSTAHWSYTYNNGSLTVSSQGTNAGGYFHQPGYYQLTYGYLGEGGEESGSYQSKTVTPTTSQQIITADTGYEALSQVTVNAIPSSYVQPTTTVGSTTYRASTSAQTIQSGTYHSAAATIAAVTQTNLTAANIKSGTTITISNGQSNLWSVTGTYTGGGSGGSFSVATTTWNNSTNTTTSHQFTGLSGTPKFAVLRCTSQLTRSSSNTYYYIADIVWNGTDAYGNYHLRSNGSFNNVASNASTKFTVTTGTNSITFTSGGTRGGAPGSFYNGTYELTYVY